MLKEKTSVLDRIRQRDFLNKFNESGPYYTSYPTLGHWSRAFEHTRYVEALKDFFSNEGDGAPLTLYVHIPFCAKLCWYCICNIRITNNREHIQYFLDHLLREIDLLWAFFDRYSIRPNVREIHLGGGTPSHLYNDQLAQLIDRFGQFVAMDELDELAMEIDPRTTTHESLKFFSEKGVTRISFGVQDFDPDVQQAINRVQPPKLVESLLSPEVRSCFTGVNFDLLYGLPLQTRQTFKNTVEIVKQLSPERITLLKYAHVPHLRKHMKLIKESDLPARNDFPLMFTECVEAFMENGYEWIGIDNFARPSDVLAQAVRNKTLGRDFNGWNARTTHLIGIGPTATSAFGDYYSQNVYGLKDYYRAIDEGRFALERGYRLTSDDRVRREVIFRILCHQVVDFDAIGHKYKVDYEQYFAEELRTLNNGFARDGMIEFSNDTLQVTHFGRFFSRNIAKVFDYFLKGKIYQITGP
ncbi:oxygen-independent coproporphyrinogen III oxidase [Acidobacteria bacterium AH-259-D05]|nr:oxygen-independent coproporphyrinogen III oxidase [Acidobacteria bacterium AH-259-D05]